MQRSASCWAPTSAGRGSHWSPGRAREKVGAVWGTPGPRQEGCVAQGAGRGAETVCVHTSVCLRMSVGAVPRAWLCVCVSSLHSLAWAGLGPYWGATQVDGAYYLGGEWPCSGPLPFIPHSPWRNVSTGWSLWFASASIWVQAGVGSEVSLWLRLGGGAGTVMGVRGQSALEQRTGESSATPLPLPLAEPRWAPGRHEAARCCSQDQVGTPARPEALGAGDHGHSQKPRVPSPENAERDRGLETPARPLLQPPFSLSPLPSTLLPSLTLTPFPTLWPSSMLPKCLSVFPLSFSFSY